MLNEVEIVLEDAHKLIANNYTHIKPGFKIPAIYSPKLIRENYSVKPKVVNNSLPT